MIFHKKNTLIPSYKLIDHRPIGRLFVCEIDYASRSNPAGWIFDRYDGGTLSEQMKNYALTSITLLKRLNAQRMIVWDFEGARYPKSSYLGSPDLITVFNP